MMVRLPREQAEYYDKVKSSLLLSIGCQLRHFAKSFVMQKKLNGSPTRSNKLMAILEEWCKQAKAFSEHDKVVQCFGLEQVYRRLPENVMHWVQDRPT